MIDSILMFWPSTPPSRRFSSWIAACPRLCDAAGFAEHLGRAAAVGDDAGPTRSKIAPTLALSLWGILHFVADAIKMMFKEDVVPAKGRPLPVCARAGDGDCAGADHVRGDAVWSPTCASAKCSAW